MQEILKKFLNFYDAKKIPPYDAKKNVKI